MKNLNTSISHKSNLNWDSYAKHYHNLTHLVSYKNLIKDFLEHTRKYTKSGSKRILDIGCGTGYLTFILSKRYPNSEVIGIDNNEIMLQKARKNKRSNLTFLKFDILHLRNFSKGKFDVIVVNNVLYILKNKVNFLKNVKNLLVENGVVIISDPKPPEEYSYFTLMKEQLNNLKSFLKFLTLLPSFTYIFLFNKKIDRRYFRLTRKQYLEIIKKCGFSVLSVKNSYAKQANMFILRKS